MKRNHIWLAAVSLIAAASLLVSCTVIPPEAEITTPPEEEATTEQEVVTDDEATEEEVTTEEEVATEEEVITDEEVVIEEEAVPTDGEEVVEPPAHSSAYIKFEGVDGESKQKGHEGWSEIISFNHSISLPGSSTTITRRRGDVVFEDIAIVKQVDKSSPKLAESICKGAIFTKVEIHLTGPSEGSTCQGTFYAYEFKNVMITNYQVSGSNPLAYALIAPAPDVTMPSAGPFIAQAVDAPMEEISFNFEEIKVTYTECDSAGKSKGNVEYSWKVEEGEL